MKHMHMLLVSIICTNSVLYCSERDDTPPITPTMAPRAPELCDDFIPSTPPLSPQLDNQQQIALEWINSASPTTLRACPRIAQFADDEMKALGSQGLLFTQADLRTLSAAGLLFSRQQLADHDKDVGKIAVLEWQLAQEQAKLDRLQQEIQNDNQRRNYVKKHPIRATILIAACVTTGIGCTTGLWQAGYL